MKKEYINPAGCRSLIVCGILYSQKAIRKNSVKNSVPSSMENRSTERGAGERTGGESF